MKVQEARIWFSVPRGKWMLTIVAIKTARLIKIRLESTIPLP